MDANLPLQIQAYNILKEKILTGEFSANTLYSETKTAMELSISRTPLRNALRGLEQDGYIVIAPSKGFWLRTLDKKGLKESIEIRSAIEGYCIYRAADEINTARGKALIDELDGILRGMEECAKDPSRQSEFIDLDHMFHAKIIGFVDNAEQQAEIQRIHYLMRQTSESALRTEGRVADTLQEHLNIFHFLREGDAVSAYQEMLRHLSIPLTIIDSKE